MGQYRCPHFLEPYLCKYARTQYYLTNKQAPNINEPFVVICCDSSYCLRCVKAVLRRMKTDQLNQLFTAAPGKPSALGLLKI